jgi:predicted transcriptional regulator
MPVESSLIDFASTIVAAYVTHNHVARGDVPAVIATVHAALLKVAAGQADVSEAAPEQPNAAQIRKSVQPDRIISFIDGRAYKTMKRHLTAHGLTPATYRERFGLPIDYPMVAASYSERRSTLAKAHGLGAPASEDGAANPKRRAS